MSEELLNDSAFDLESYIAGEFARRIGTKEEEAFLIGDGKNKPTGVFPSAELGVTANGASITFDDVIDLYHSLRIPYRRKAVWLLNDATIKALRKIKDNNGNYIWQPSVTAGTPDTILNRPCYSTSFAPELAAGSRPCSSAISATTGLPTGNTAPSSGSTNCMPPTARSASSPASASMAC